MDSMTGGDRWPVEAARQDCRSGSACRMGGNETVSATIAPAADGQVLDTVPKLLLRNAAQHANRPAMRHKDFGIWQTWTWAQMRDEVRAFAVGLRKLGLRARRRRDHHRRQPPAAVLRHLQPCRASAASPVPAIPGLGCRRDGLRARPRRSRNSRWCRTRSRSTSSSPSPTGCRSCAPSSIEEERGLAAYDPANLHSFAHVQELGREEMRRNPGAAGWWLDEIAKARGPTSA